MEAGRIIATFSDLPHPSTLNFRIMLPSSPTV